MTRPPRLLVSDLDGTLLGDPAALERFAQWYAPRRDELRLVYASGRFFDSVVESIRATALPHPHVVIGGVGSELRHYPSGRAWSSWPTENCRGWCPAQVDEIACAFADVEPQPSEFLSSCKRSFFAHNWSARQIAALQAALWQHGVRATVIYSSQRDLDVLPAGVNKGTAAATLQHEWNLCADQVLVAGNTGNDLDLFRHGFRGIVVANADAELRERATHTYHAARAYAAGVQEGCTYWLTQSSAATDQVGDRDTLAESSPRSTLETLSPSGVQ